MNLRVVGVALLFVPALGCAQAGFDFKTTGFVARNLTFADEGSGITPQFAVSAGGHIFFVSEDLGEADLQIVDFGVDRTVENGLRFTPDTTFENALTTTSPPLRPVFGSFGSVVINSSKVTAFPVEGDDEFSSDIYTLRADTGIGALVPTVNAASQFKPRLAPATPLGVDPEVVIASLQAGPLRNELYAVRATFGSSGVGFGTQYRLDDGGGQITDHFIANLAFSIVFSRAKGNATAGYFHVWDAFGSGTDNSLRGIQARTSDENGQPTGSQFQVNTFTDGDQSGARVASNGEAVVVVWTSQGSPGDDDSGTSIQARLFNASGSPLGDQFQVNQAVMGDQFQPAVAMTADGRFLVTWTDIPLITSNVLARVFGADGAPLSDAFPLSTDPGADLPSVAFTDNDALVMWRQGSDLLARVSLDGVFANGFEN